MFDSHVYFLCIFLTFVLIKPWPKKVLIECFYYISAFLSFSYGCFSVVIIAIQKQSPEVFCEKGVLRNFANSPQACNFIKKEALTQVFSCKFCEIFKNIFFYRTPPVAAFGHHISHKDEIFLLFVYKLSWHSQNR